MTSQRIELIDEAATARLGQRLAGLLQAGDCLCLSGPLGAGKSSLARAVIRTLTTPDEEVPSPTFTLVQTYEARLPLAHLDLYRLDNPEEVLELGLEDILDTGVAIIEWPERLGPHRPVDRLEIVLQFQPDGSRRAQLTGFGAWKDRAF